LKATRTLLTLALCLFFPAIANALEYKFADAETAREIVLAQDDAALARYTNLAIDFAGTMLPK